MIIKKIKNKLIRHLKLSQYLWSSRKNGIYCFNFHRIGNADNCQFDPCVYSCTQEALEEHLVFIKENFIIINEDEFISLVNNKKKPDKAYAYITFDDGYIDNYELAYPTLKSLAIPATFFVATGLIETNITPWWDEIAWHVKGLKSRALQLPSWDSAIKLDVNITQNNIREVLTRFKSSTANIDTQLAELRQLSGKKLNSTQNEFMTWEQLATMEKNGMTISAHSHSHRIFSSLTNEELIHELSYAKELLDTHLEKSVVSISYPVGGANTYNKNMFEEIELQGYKIAFSFIYGLNQNLYTNKYQLARISISEPFDKEHFMQLCLNAPTL
jgi:peptidoglycan/xylan/chitin deacetylase (PgdA/CDA1 family)